MMPWGSTVETIGNNPIVYAMPSTKYTVVLDMALSQFSYGKIQSIESLGKPLDFMEDLIQRRINKDLVNF